MNIDTVERATMIRVLVAGLVCAVSTVVFVVMLWGDNFAGIVGSAAAVMMSATAMLYEDND